jgi:hypothetical protein
VHFHPGREPIAWRIVGVALALMLLRGVAALRFNRDPLPRIDRYDVSRVDRGADPHYAVEQAAAVSAAACPPGHARSARRGRGSGRTGLAGLLWNRPLTCRMAMPLTAGLIVATNLFAAGAVPALASVGRLVVPRGSRSLARGWAPRGLCCLTHGQTPRGSRVLTPGRAPRGRRRAMSARTSAAAARLPRVALNAARDATAARPTGAIAVATNRTGRGTAIRIAKTAAAGCARSSISRTRRGGRPHAARPSAWLGHAIVFAGGPVERIGCDMNVMRQLKMGLPVRRLAPPRAVMTLPPAWPGHAIRTGTVPRGTARLGRLTVAGPAGRPEHDLLSE